MVVAERRVAAPASSVVLDIGDDVGALIILTSDELDGREVEISPRDVDWLKTHAVVRPRRIGSQRVAAAVFPELPQGEYTLWRNGQDGQPVVVRGGVVAEVDWRARADIILRPASPEWRDTDAALPPLSADDLPPRYRQGAPVCRRPMGSAPLRYDADGQVAWGKIWQGYCDLAVAGGPPHRETVLQAPTPVEALAAPVEYARVVAEIERGLRLVTGLACVRGGAPGWVGLRCTDQAMARWLVWAITAENVAVRREGAVLYVPAGPLFERDREIKNVVTAVAKTCHYWQEHRAVTNSGLA